MIACNRLQQATAELKKYKPESGTIPNEIQVSEKGYYVFVCMKSKDNFDKTEKIHSFKVRFLSEHDYNKQQRQIKRKLIKQLFASMFNKVVLLHDPNIKEEPKKLSNQLKGKVKTMHQAGDSAENIAEALEADLGLVKEHINKL